MDKLILLVADITKDNGSQTILIKNEITEEEVQEWKRGVSNRKETME